MKTIKAYQQHMHKIAALSSTAALLQWDQEVYMPPNGNAARANQLALLSTMIHELASSPKLGKFLKQQYDKPSLSASDRLNIKRTLQDYEKSVKIPAALVEQLSRAQSEAFHAWIQARKEKDFAIFQPSLEKIIDLKRTYAEHLNPSTDPYENLMDLYDPGIKLDKVDAIFEQLIPGIHSILNKMDSDKFSRHLPKGKYPSQKQLQLGKTICESLGFNFQAGRQDLAEHPFTIGIYPSDVRITTRVDEQSLAYMLWSTIHECGHALYEQGLKPEFHGFPLGEAASLSIHESQSRLYENNLGRSKAFIDYWFPIIRKTFPESMELDAEQYYYAVNQVSPNLVRTEADELHYHIHIYIRYLIERDLIQGNLKVAQVRDRWNSLYEEHMGLTVTDDKAGVLQDVHWAHASIGYFPTYTMGSLYAAQFMDAAFAQIDNLQKSLEEGDYMPLLTWLREKIHIHGREFHSDELCERVTGISLNSKYFIRYSNTKYLI